MSFYSIILAAGVGKRMKSAKVKPLHSVCGKPMIDWVTNVANAAGSVKNIVVVGHGEKQMREHLKEDVTYAVQSEQLGTGHAVIQGIESIKNENGTVLVICGDTPLITAETLKSALNVHLENKSAATVITAIAPNPAGYGRIVRDGYNFAKIIEHVDANESELKIQEVNSGMYFFDIQKLNAALALLTTNNTQKEYYLTDTIRILLSSGNPVSTYTADFEEMLGVNDRAQLAQANAILNSRIINYHMLSGVTILDPFSTHIEDNVEIGMDTIIYPNTYIHSDVKIGKNCSIGPFAYIRPHSVIGNRVKVGDFVEIKNSFIDNGTKASHLTYIGDANVGKNVNFGCGTVLVNYDGKRKHRSTIEDNAFIGCNANLVSPVNVKKGAYVAAGSTITDEVPEGALAIARQKQVVKENWVEKKGMNS